MSDNTNTPRSAIDGERDYRDIYNDFIFGVPCVEARLRDAIRGLEALAAAIEQVADKREHDPLVFVCSAMHEQLNAAMAALYANNAVAALALPAPTIYRPPGGGFVVPQQATTCA